MIFIVLIPSHYRLTEVNLLLRIYSSLDGYSAVY